MYPNLWDINQLEIQILSEISVLLVRWPFEMKNLLRSNVNSKLHLLVLNPINFQKVLKVPALIVL